MGNAGSEGESMGCEGRGKRIAIVTFGCQMNTRDAEVIAGIFQRAGFGLADSAEQADVVIFVTCAVRQHAEDKVWSEIGRIAKKRRLDCVLRLDRRIRSGNDKKNNPGSDTRREIPIIGLVGCMAQEHKEKAFERSPDIDFVAGPQDIDKIPEIVKKIVLLRRATAMSGLAMTRKDADFVLRLDRRNKPGNDNNPLLFERKIWETDGQGRPEEIYHTGFYNENGHAYVVISEGCSNFCSYCVVPYVRGPLRHRNSEDILQEIEQAVSSDSRRITLLGQNVCAYVSNAKLQSKIQNLEKEKIGFIQLLKLINNIEKLDEFSFITSHPKDTSVELFEVMQDSDKLKKYLHLPVQSGSDRILKLMNRGYSRKYYLDLAKNYRKIVTNGVLTTDIIVGFPGETKKDFEDTVDLVKQAEFDAGFIFKYSPRPQTRALNFADDVTKEEKERRHAVILELQKSISKGKR